MTTPAIPETRMGRLAFIAEALGVAVPAGLPADLLDADGGPAKEVSLFCDQTGASLDLIFRGDIRPMLLGDYNRARKSTSEETPVMRLYRKYVAALKTLAKAPPCPDADLAPINDEMNRIEREMLALPSAGTRDFAAKMLVAHGFGDW